MSFLKTSLSAGKSVSAWMVLAVAGVLLFAGGAAAADVCDPTDDDYNDVACANAKIVAAQTAVESVLLATLTASQSDVTNEAAAIPFVEDKISSIPGFTGLVYSNGVTAVVADVAGGDAFTAAEQNGDDGSYNYTVTLSIINGTDVVIERNLVITADIVARKPAISSQPSFVGKAPVVVGDVLAVSVTAEIPSTPEGTKGVGTLSYQWYKVLDPDKFNIDDYKTTEVEAVSGATANSFTPVTGAAGKYAYFVIVKNTIMNSNTSPTVNAAEDISTLFELTVLAAEAASNIDIASGNSNSNDFTVLNTQSIKLSATVTGGDDNGEVITYQWYSVSSAVTTGGVAISKTEGGESKDYTYAAVGGSSSADVNKYFYLVVTSTLTSGVTPAAGQQPKTSVATMKSAVVTVTIPKIVNAQTPTLATITLPQDYTTGKVAVGQTVTLNVTATSPDNGTLTYQWVEKANLTDVSGTPKGTTTSQLVSGLSANSVVYYAVKVTNTITTNPSDGGNKIADTIAVLTTPIIFVPIKDAVQPQPVWKTLTGLTCAPLENQGDLGTLVYGTFFNQNDLTKKLTGACTVSGTYDATADGLSANEPKEWTVNAAGGGLDGTLTYTTKTASNATKRITTAVGGTVGVIISYQPAAANNPNSRNPVKSDEIGIAVVENEPVLSKDHLNTDVLTDSKLVSWLATPRYATGAPVEIPLDGIAPVANSPKLDGLGALSLTYKEWDNSTSPGTLKTSGYNSDAGPTEAGLYGVVVAFDKGSNFNESRATLTYGPFEVKYENYTEAKFALKSLVDSTSVSFSRNGADVGYAFKWPTLSGSANGTIDSVFNVTVKSWRPKLGSGSTATEADVRTVVNMEDRTIVLYAADAGDAELNIQLQGSTKAGIIWQTKDPIVFKPTVNPKKLDSANVEVHELVTISYTGASITNNELAKKFDVFDGANVLRRAHTTNDASTTTDNPGDYFILPIDARSKLTPPNRTNAGPAQIRIQGRGNYTGTVEKTFNIEKAKLTATLAVNGKTQADWPRKYDGTVNIDTTSNKATVKNWVSLNFPAAGTAGGPVKPSATAAGETLVNVKDFTITEAKYDAATAGDRVLSAVVTLTNGARSTSRNYLLVKDDGTADSSVTLTLPTEIAKLTPTKDNISYTVPKHYYNGEARGVGEMTLKSPLAESDPGVTVFPVYNTANSVATATEEAGAGDEKKDVTYKLWARVLGNENIDSVFVALEDYKILKPIELTITNQPQSGKVREGQAVDLKVAVNPAANIGELTYVWYKMTSATDVDTSVSKIVEGADEAVYPAGGASKGDKMFYRVKVTNYNPTVQVTRSVLSAAATIDVIEPAIVLTSANSRIDLNEANIAKYAVYSGNEIKVSAGDIKVIYIDPVKGDVTIPVSQYRLDHSDNVNAGTASVFAFALSGVASSYAGTVSASFNIAKKNVTNVNGADLQWTASRVYDGEATGANVRAATNKSGLGALTVTYRGETAAPADAGSYALAVSVAEGTNFNATAEPLTLGNYVISKKTPVLTDFVFNIPAGHNLATTTEFGIGDVTLKGTGYGAVTVLYDGLAAPTAWAAKTYKVTANVAAGDNYNAATAIALGDYRVTATSVAESDRAIPGTGKTEVTAISPVKTVTASFTAGPSPVSKAAGKITFFSGKNVKNGTVQIFDASGRAAAKVKVSGTGAIGSWNLKDKKGATAAIGTYIAKGVLTGKDGTKEKVSFLFSIVQ